MKQRKTMIAVALVYLAVAPIDALACSTCGCTLSSDWSSQGIAPSGEGFRFDFRFDYFNQNQLRSGTRKVDRGSLEIPNEREIQQSTINRNYTFGFDYSPNMDWGVNLQLPYFNRSHTTIAEGDTEISSSHTQSIGDVRLVGSLSRIRRGAQCRRAIGTQVRHRQLQQQLHHRTTGG